MHHTLRCDFMLKIVLLIVIMLLLTGCGGVGMDEKVQKEQTHQYTIDVKTPQIKGLSDDEVQARLNNRFLADSEKLTASFRESVSDSEAKMQYLTVVPHLYRGKNTASIVTEVHEFTGGAHEVQSRIAVTLDLKSNREMRLADLFIDEKWREFVNGKLLQAVENDSERYAALWERPVIMTDQPFYIDGAALIIYYPPYELSYYARGFVDFSIPLSELEGYMKTDYYDRE